MSSFSSSTVASSYDRLLVLPSGGGDSTNLVSLTDGNAATTFGLKLSISDISIPATGKIYLDNGNNTYISKTSNDIVDIIVSGERLLRLDKTNDSVDITATRLSIRDTDDTSPRVSIYSDTDASIHKIELGGSGYSTDILQIGRDDGNHAIGLNGMVWVTSGDGTGSDSAIGFKTFSSGNQTDRWRIGVDESLSDQMYWYDDVGNKFRMMLSTDGKLKFGNDDALSTSVVYPFHVQGIADGSYVAIFDNNGNTLSHHGIAVYAGHSTGSTVGTTYYMTAADGGGSATGYLKTVDGVFQLADASDIRLKENVVNTTINGLTTVNAMQVRDFDWKDSGATITAGFIANELKDVFAPAVDGEADAMEDYPAEYDNDGNEIKAAGTRIDPMTVSRDRLVPVLVKAIQELSAKVTVLENA